MLPHSAPDPRGDYSFDLRIDTSDFPARIERDDEETAADGDLGGEATS